MIPDIKQAFFHCYFIFDVADIIDLTKLQNIGGTSYEKAQLELRSVSSPAHIQFADPPIATNLSDVNIEGATAKTRAKFYDYGTVSIKLSFQYSGSWAGFAEFTNKIKHSYTLLDHANKLLKDCLDKVSHALYKPHEALVEDYFVMEVGSFVTDITAGRLLEKYRQQLACLVLGESKPLTHMEQEDALRQAFSYYETDLTIIHWDCAFVFDRGEAAKAINSILEFANTQLVEWRTYDARLDRELEEIYKWNLADKQPVWILGHRVAEQRTKRTRSLLVEIGELTDRTNNALKIIGDAFYARLYRGAASRLGLSDWQQQIETKLDSVGDIYRFNTDQVQNARSEFLELIIIALITFEIVVGFFKHTS